MRPLRCVAVSVILKVGMLTEATEDTLGSQLRSRFVFDAGLVSAGMVASILGALILAFCMAIMQLIQASRLPLLKLVDSRSQPDLPLAPGHRWHMFLSHSRTNESNRQQIESSTAMTHMPPAPLQNVAVWGTGQDQCATIKRQLTLLMPDVSIFLDVLRCSNTSVTCAQYW